MSCYSTIHSGGDKFTSDERILIYLYPNTTETKNEAENAMANGLRDACEYVYNYSGDIGYYEINVNTAYPSVNTGTGARDMLNKWKDWLSKNSCNGSTYDSRTGSHNLVTHEYYGGYAKVGTPTAFNTSKAALTGMKSYVKEAYINTAIQEIFHNFLNKSAIENADPTLIDKEDHDLGKVYSDCSVSPMASGYEDTHARKGACSPSNAFCGSYTRRPTSCTEEGMDYSARDA